MLPEVVTDKYWPAFWHLLNSRDKNSNDNCKPLFPTEITPRYLALFFLTGLQHKRLKDILGNIRYLLLSQYF